MLVRSQRLDETLNRWHIWYGFKHHEKNIPCQRSLFDGVGTWLQYNRSDVALNGLSLPSRSRVNRVELSYLPCMIYPLCLDVWAPGSVCGTIFKSLRRSAKNMLRCSITNPARRDLSVLWRRSWACQGRYRCFGVLSFPPFVMVRYYLDQPKIPSENSWSSDHSSIVRVQFIFFSL